MYNAHTYISHTLNFRAVTIKKIWPIQADWRCSTLEGMENYTKLGKLGEGAYGVVYKVNLT